MKNVITIGSSVIGESHKRNGLCNQDSFGIRHFTKGIFVVVCDGVGSALYAEKGSRETVDILLGIDFENVLNQGDMEGVQGLLRQGFQKAYDRFLGYVSKGLALSIYDYATTVTGVMYTDKGIIVGHVGDSGAIGLKENGEIVKLTQVMNGESANMTYTLQNKSEFWRIYEGEKDIVSMVLATDGLYDVFIPPGDEGQPEEILLNDFLRMKYDKSNRNKLNRYLKNYLEDFHKEYVSDDKTMIVLIKEKGEKIRA